MSAIIRILVLLAAAAVAVLPACGSDEGSGAGSSDGGSPSASEIEMTDVATGATTTLDEALSSDDGRPVLAWFWAPFCPTCRGEAPGLDAFMADNADRVQMVGVGTRNDLDRAEEFLADTGVQNFPLLWEPSGESWVEYAVAAQPYTILLVDGEEVQRWPGGASVRQIEDELAQL